MTAPIPLPPIRRAPPAKDRPNAAGPATPDLGPQAEAFRAELAAGRIAQTSDFGDWRRAQNRQRWLIWAVTLLSFSPGLVSLLLDAPLELSIGLEVAAFIGNIWLRRNRRRRMREIVKWEGAGGRGA